MATSTIYHPGEIVPTSGIYAEVDRFFQRTRRNVTSVKGEPFPPTQGSGVGYVLIQVTNP